MLSEKLWPVRLAEPWAAAELVMEEFGDRAVAHLSAYADAHRRDGREHLADEMTYLIDAVIVAEAIAGSASHSTTAAQYAVIRLMFRFNLDVVPEVCRLLVSPEQIGSLTSNAFPASEDLNERNLLSQAKTRMLGNLYDASAATFGFEFALPPLPSPSLPLKWRGY